jgi:hypothetical protein
MGKTLSEDQRYGILNWCKSFRPDPICLDVKGLSISQIINAYKPWLINYAAAGQIASATARPFKEKDELRSQLFPVRIRIEKALANSLRPIFYPDMAQLISLYKRKFFGYSKKQGVSLRLALTTCEPTTICGSKCYAHDALDATPAAVVRGVLNTVLIERWCEDRSSSVLSKFVDSEISYAARAAHQEAKSSKFVRQPRIRLSHVGEAAAYPDFVNYIASKLDLCPEGSVKCVIYTRHSKARHLDTKHLVVNFSLDDSSRHKLNWLGNKVRYVSSSFDGLLMNEVAVNFLEHHNREHLMPIGTGFTCPVTAGGAARTCDTAKCDLCFQEPICRI